MAHNTFSFDPHNGVMAGLPVSRNIPTTRNDGSVYPPHVKCDGHFIMVDKVKPPVVQGGRVVEAHVRTIYPTNAQPEFQTLSSEGAGGVLLLASTRGNYPRIKEKQILVNAWEGIISDAGVEPVLCSANSTLVLLTKQDQTVDVFLANGLVHRLRLDCGKVTLDRLTKKEMAMARVEQFYAQFDDSSEIKHIRYILGGAIRLLRATADDVEVRKVFRDFLEHQLDNLTSWMKSEVRQILLSVNDIYAGNFLEGYASNILSFEKPGATSSARRPSDTKRRARQEADKLTRLQMRGDSNGGNSGQKAGKRK